MPGIVHHFSTSLVVSARNAWSGVPATSAKARIIPATPSTAALGALFDSVAALKSDLVFDSVGIFLLTRLPKLLDISERREPACLLAQPLPSARCSLTFLQVLFEAGKVDAPARREERVCFISP